VRFTYAGDADLNGSVDLGDFDAWLYGFQHQNSVPHDWANGDFDYDGAITLADFDSWLFSWNRHFGSLGAQTNQIAAVHPTTPASGLFSDVTIQGADAGVLD
jgi:hypothetical protein